MEVQEYGTNKRTKMFEMFKIIQMKTMPKGNTVTTVFFDSKSAKNTVFENPFFSTEDSISKNTVKEYRHQRTMQI